MLFDPKHFNTMRKSHQNFRPLMVAVAAAPLLLWMFAIIMLSADTIAVRTRHLHVVPATVSPKALDPRPGHIELTYPCGRETKSITVTAAQLGIKGSASENEILQKAKAGKPFKVGVNSACEIKMFRVSQPPFWLYGLFTLFMAVFTGVWAVFVMIIYKAQRKMLDGADKYLNTTDNR